MLMENPGQVAGRRVEFITSIYLIFIFDVNGSLKTKII